MSSGIERVGEIRCGSFSVIGVGKAWASGDTCVEAPRPVWCYGTREDAATTDPALARYFPSEAEVLARMADGIARHPHLPPRDAACRAVDSYRLVDALLPLLPRMASVSNRFRLAYDRACALDPRAEAVGSNLENARQEAAAFLAAEYPGVTGFFDDETLEFVPDEEAGV